jgi:hypothetical protein
MLTASDLLETPVDVPPGTGVLIVPQWDLGHAEFRWDKKDKADVDAARKHFVELKAKGYSAFRVDPKSGDKGEVLKEFDEGAEKIIMVPPVIGG